MKALVVYDSLFGNTEHLAQAIAETLGVDEPATVLAVGAASARDLTEIDLLAIGGPTQGHGLSPALKTFLDGLPDAAMRGMPTVTFDTRLPWPRFLSGSAAGWCARQLEKKGARLLVPPESFLVSAQKGPLVAGEVARAQAWARKVRAEATNSIPETTVAAQ